MAGTNLKAIRQSVPADFDENEDKLLIEAYIHVIWNTWLLVSKHLKEKTGYFHASGDCPTVRIALTTSDRTRDSDFPLW